MWRIRLKTSSNKEVKDPSPQNQKTFKKNVIPGSSTLKKDSESETSSSEDDSKSRVVPSINISPFVTAPKNNTMVSEQPSVRKSDNSDSENDSDTSQENGIPDHKQPPNLNSKHSNDANSSSSSSESESEKPRRPSPKKEVQSESGSDDSDSTSRGPVLRGPLPSGNEPSSDSYQSEHEIIPATQELSGRFTSLANISTKRDTSGSDQDRLVGASKSSKLRSPSKQPKNPKLSDKEVDKKSSLTVLPVLKSSEGNVSSNYTDSEDDKVTLTNKPSSQYATIRQAQSSSSSDDSDSDHKGVDNSRKSVKETSLQGTPTESIPHRNDSQITRTNVTSFSNSPKAPIGGLPSKLKVERNNDSSSTSDSSDSEQEESANAKSLLSLNNHQDSLPQGKESRKNCHSDSKDNVRQQSPTKGLVGNNPRKRKADSISSTDGSDNEHKNKVRKIISPPENVPFNSTRNPEVDETSFPGSDISVIPKIKGSSTAMNYQGTMDNQETPRSLPSKSPSAPATKDPGSQFQKPGQLSIREFARPISTASLTTSQDNYETLKQEYFDAGYSNLKERYDFESYEGLLEEDLLDNDNEVYVVQCPREVDPMTLVGKEIDVSSKESVVELRVAGGQVVLHDIYCDLSDSEFGINVVVPSRNKKKFTLNTVPVNGRLTIVESVEVPQIDEFDISSPPRIPLPDNLRARNSFVGSDESTAQSISGSPRKISQGKLGRAIPKDHQVLFQTKNTIPLLKEKSQKRN
uniref:Uncharacterized protein n=1 Tax=Lygus hesperus TaxID=30085 RepID=A0A0K8SSJ6_LYGHE